MKTPARVNKCEHTVKEVEFIDLSSANPDYAHDKLPDGRETTVSNDIWH